MFTYMHDTHLFIACFNLKVALFQQTAVSVYYILNSLDTHVISARSLNQQLKLFHTGTQLQYIFTAVSSGRKMLNFLLFLFYLHLPQAIPNGDYLV